ncbi:NB-ARC domains-containing protein [Tanacetum coccineum]
MAELILTALLKVIFEKLTSVAVNKITRSKEIHSELKKWERSLSHIQSFLEDASQKEVTQAAVKQWLNGLQHLAYDIDDILDALATDAMSHEFTNMSEGISSKVRKLIPACCTNFSLSTRMDGKLNSITARLQELIDEKNNLGLIVKDGGQKNKNRNYQTSLVDAPSIVGREDDKKELLQKLLGDEPCSQNFSIVPIVGMGGMGKTTLARLLYDDQQVKDHFELKAWVCVSEDFDCFNIRKRFLLVLDDIMEPKNVGRLGNTAGPSFEWLVDANNHHTRGLRLHGEGIVKKCDGLPLALKALGSLLRTKTDEEDWKQLLNNEIWTLEDGGGVLPALRLSYYDLSARLKQLFAYCCLIPRIRVCRKDDLILCGCGRVFDNFQLPNKSMESLGEECIQRVVVKGLDKVQSARDIREVNLSQKRVSELRVEWSDDFNDARNETLENEVMNALKPHSDYLKDLLIKSYGGKVFPKWIADPSFLLLTRVRISGCQKCVFLPPLGQLPSLKELDIHGLNEVKVVGSEFLGAGIAFPKLESLSFANMSGWEVWSTNSGVVDAVFPRLQTLAIAHCPNLVEVSFQALPSMRDLDLDDCGDGVLTSLIHAASAVTKLTISRISRLSDEVWRGVMDYLGAVEEVSIYECNEIRYLWESEAKASKVLVNLRKLKVYNCSKLVSLGEKEEEDGCNQLTSLRILELRRCENLERCKLPNNIQELYILRCDSIASVSFPIVGGHKLKSLEINGCEKLLEKELLNPSMPAMLEVVWISSWKILKSIKELTCFIHMKKLEISRCSSIESFPAADLPNLTSLTHLMIRDCKSMDVDSFGLWPPKLGFLKIGGLKKPISKMGPQNFPPSLVVLALFGGSAEEDDVSSGSQLSHMLPSSLTELHLCFFGKLESVSMGLQHLTSLQHLYIGFCRINISPRGLTN